MKHAPCKRKNRIRVAAGAPFLGDNMFTLIGMAAVAGFAAFGVHKALGSPNLIQVAKDAWTKITGK